MTTMTVLKAKMKKYMTGLNPDKVTVSGLNLRETTSAREGLDIFRAGAIGPPDCFYIMGEKVV